MLKGGLNTTTTTTTITAATTNLRFHLNIIFQANFLKLTEAVYTFIYVIYIRRYTIKHYSCVILSLATQTLASVDQTNSLDYVVLNKSGERLQIN